MENLIKSTNHPVFSSICDPLQIAEAFSNILFHPLNQFDGNLIRLLSGLWKSITKDSWGVQEIFSRFSC